MLTQFVKLRILLGLVLAGILGASEDVLLNASYDATRALFTDVNAAFVAHWQGTGDGAVKILQSHGGSGKQARSVVEGMEADVVSLALALDVDEIAKSGLLPTDWRALQPGGVSPWTSTVVMLVRKGNPKGIKDWGDLARTDIMPLIASPKTSGAARLAYLATWAWAQSAHPGDEAAVRAFMAGWLKRVPTFDAGARGATATFVRRGIGDVLLTWENEAWQAAAESQGGGEIVVPSTSILAEPPFAVVDAVATRHGTRELAKAYIAFLATPTVQEIAARHYYRPRDAAVLARHAAAFPPLHLATVEDAFGGWAKAQLAHFTDGGSFDQLLEGN
jgi:sulfate/thiosulfate transport system substrate-binding protein